MLPDLHTGFSRGRSGGLVFPSLSEFSTVIVIHTVKDVGIVNKQKKMLFWNSLAFSMIQWLFDLWFLCLFQNQPESLEVHGSHIFTTICKTFSQWEPAIKHRKLSSVLCDDLVGLVGGVGGREGQEAGCL